MDSKRLKVGIVAGALLGILCIIGVSYRLGFTGNELFIFATWFNRVMMGLLIGFASYYGIKETTSNIVFYGALFGLVVSGAHYLATAFRDTPGFIAGIVYGVIIFYAVTRYKK